MKVFISYGVAADQVTALRLQALAAVNGLSVFVPPAYTRDEILPGLDADVGQKLAASEVVLGVIGAGLSAACRNELSAGMLQAKHMIVMAHPAFAPKRIELTTDQGSGGFWGESSLETRVDRRKGIKSNSPAASGRCFGREVAARGDNTTARHDTVQYQ